MAVVGGERRSIAVVVTAGMLVQDIEASVLAAAAAVNSCCNFPSAGTDWSHSLVPVCVVTEGVDAFGAVVSVVVVVELTTAV